MYEHWQMNLKIILMILFEAAVRIYWELFVVLPVLRIMETLTFKDTVIVVCA